MIRYHVGVVVVVVACRMLSRCKLWHHDLTSAKLDRLGWWD